MRLCTFVCVLCASVSVCICGHLCTNVHVGTSFDIDAPTYSLTSHTQHIGLSEAFVNFTRTFSPDRPCETVRFLKQKVCVCVVMCIVLCVL